MEKTYLILGASSDVAASFIKKMDTDHNGDSITVIAHYNSSVKKLDALQSQLKNTKIIPIRADLSNEEEVAALVCNVKKYVDAPDYYLHFPATKFEYMRYKELDIKKVRDELEVGLYSFLTISREFFPLMQKKEGARAVVMLTSYVADDIPPKFMTHYIVAKYGLLGAMKAAAAEFGGKKFMINGISPVMMKTSFLDNMDPHIIELNEAKSSIGRIPTSDELVPFIESLLKEDLSVNGSNLVVNEEDFA